MLRCEKKIIDFLQKYWAIFAVILITILAGLARLSLREFKSDDFIYFLSPWYEDLKANGGLARLANFPGNYNAPYMTILAILTYLPFRGISMIKMVSVFGDFLLAGAVVLLVLEIARSLRPRLSYERRKVLLIITYVAVLLLPSVVMNSAMWAQCDSLYTAFIVFALYFLLREKYVPSFIMLGVAFAFKLQFIFILPLFIIYYATKKKFSILHFLIIPAVDFVMCLPAIIAGWPIQNIWLVYFGQADWYDERLTLNFPNLYSILRANALDFHGAALYIGVAVILLVVILLVVKRIKFNAEKVLLVAILTMTLATFVLPNMHERYLFAGEILMVIYYIVYRKHLPLLITMLTIPLITYTSYLYGYSYPDGVIAIVYLGVLAFSYKKILKEIYE